MRRNVWANAAGGPLVWVQGLGGHGIALQVNISCQLHPEAQLALQLTLAPDFSEVQAHGIAGHRQESIGSHTRSLSRWRPT